MKILDDLISGLNFDASVRDIRLGVFHTGVLTRHCGLAASLSGDAHRKEPMRVKNPGFLLDKPPEELARMAYSKSLLEAAIGMAAINSLIEVNLDLCVELNAADLILQKGEGRQVAVVGHFPFLPRIRDKVKALWIIEKNQREGDFNENQAHRLIPQADVVAITGTSLTNHTLEHLLNLCDPNAYIIMLGGTVPLSPILFEYNVDAIAGTRVVDPDIVLRCISQGAKFRQIKGTKRFIMTKP
jgi:uncharacterized protein (DUF4213/DUF364 family)